MRNASTERRWLQVAGLPLRPKAQAVRDELDGMARVELTPHTNRAVIFDADGQPIAVADFNTDALERIQKKAAAGAVGKAVDPAKGDTVIRPIDPNNPEHKAALAGPRVLHGVDDPPPIDLPDYIPDDLPDSETTSRAKLVIGLGAVAFAIAAIGAAVAYFN